MEISIKKFGDFHRDLMLLEAFGWRFLLKIYSFSLPFDLLYSPSIPYLLFLSSLVVKLSKSFQKSVRTFFIKSLIQAKGVVQQSIRGGL